jgi:hypothetical protein
VGIAETQSIAGQCVDVRRVDLAPLTAIALDITYAEIIGQDEDDVGGPIIGLCGSP